MVTSEAVRIGNRLDTPHMLTFEGGFFGFAKNQNTVLTTQDSTGKEFLSDSDAPALIAANMGICEDNEVPNVSVSDTLGEACYTYTTSSDKVKVTEFNAEIQVITFELPSKPNSLNSGRATITIKYHVWAYSSKHVHDADADPVTPSTNEKKKIHTATETLTLNIHKCVVTTDCPINSDS